MKIYGGMGWGGGFKQGGRAGAGRGGGAGEDQSKQSIKML